MKDASSKIKETPDTERIKLSDVSDELRKITENSRDQSIAIKAALKNLRASVGEIKKSTEEVMEKFEEIDSGADTVIRFKVE